METFTTKMSNWQGPISSETERERGGEGEKFPAIPNRRGKSRTRLEGDWGIGGGTELTA